ncbi:MAG: hypothetical protein WC831_02570 [Parcubacteria group bacterium]|jgi:hypothetical protein
MAVEVKDTVLGPNCVELDIKLTGETWRKRAEFVQFAESIGLTVDKDYGSCARGYSQVSFLVSPDEAAAAMEKIAEWQS